MALGSRRQVFRRVATLAILLSLLVPLSSAVPALAQVSTTSGGTSVSWTGEYSVVQHHLPNPGAEPWEITTAANGDVWFLEQKADVLGMLDPTSGNITQYAIPTPGATPDGVVTDSGGNVWFSELTTNKLGELPAGSGTIVEHDIPGLTVSLGATSQIVGCGPGALVPDPSGAIWIACLFSNQIDEFFPSTGAFASYNLPLFYSSPAGMVLDGKGDIWFTAANAQMLGKAVISQLSNGTSDGISEFAPVNATYPYTYTITDSFLGATRTVTSSLPTPSGIVMDSSGNLWITEHVDSSFDRYNPTTKSLVRYWTSQTFGADGYSVSFPNGIAVDSNGTVWVGEHYGNKIVQFFPSTESMVEYPVPCCKGIIAGVYSVSLNPAGGVWFVEINGDAIGELVKSPDPLGLSLSLPERAFSLGPDGSISVPLKYSESPTSSNSTGLSLSLSGVTATGALDNSSGTFSPAAMTLSPGGSISSSLVLQTSGMAPGVYYITLSATTSATGAVFSTVLKLTVGSPSFLNRDLLILLAAGIAVAAGVGGLVLARRTQRGSAGRRPRRNSLKRTRAITTTPPVSPAYRA